MGNSDTTTTATSANRGGKYLTFGLGREQFGLQILKVREIIGFMEITAVPRLPRHVRGVINLRGQVISVIDLRAKFGMGAIDRTEQTCIIVVETHHADGRKVSVGIVVDEVKEVLNITPDSIEDAPDFGGAVDEQFILGMGKVEGAVKILLDIDRVLAADAVELERAAA